MTTFYIDKDCFIKKEKQVFYHKTLNHFMYKYVLFKENMSFIKDSVAHFLEHNRFIKISLFWFFFNVDVHCEPDLFTSTILFIFRRVNKFY